MSSVPSCLSDLLDVSLCSRRIARRFDSDDPREKVLHVVGNRISEPKSDCHSEEACLEKSGREKRLGRERTRRGKRIRKSSRLTFETSDLGDEVSIFDLDVSETDDTGGEKDDDSRERWPASEERREDRGHSSSSRGILVEDSCEMGRRVSSILNPTSAEMLLTTRRNSRKSEVTLRDGEPESLVGLGGLVVLDIIMSGRMGRDHCERFVEVG